MRKDFVKRLRDLRSKLNDEMLVLDQISSDFPSLKMKAVTEIVRSDLREVDSLYLQRLRQDLFKTVAAEEALNRAEQLLVMIVRSREILQAELGERIQYRTAGGI